MLYAYLSPGTYYVGVSGGEGIGVYVKVTYEGITGYVPWPDMTPGAISADQQLGWYALPDPLQNIESPANPAGTYSLFWEQAPTSNGPWTVIPGAAQLTYQPPCQTATVYYRRGATRMKDQFPETKYTTPVCLTVAHPLANGNYIATKVYLDEATAGSSSPLRMTDVQYFDGIGRPTQAVQVAATPLSGDLVALQEYDARSRESNVWLPAVFSGNAGGCVTPGAIRARAILDHGGDTIPYSKPVYEPSPLNRHAEQYGPGALFHSGGKSVRTEHGANTSADSLNALRFTITGTGEDAGLTAEGTYAPGTLHITATTDPDGRRTLTFTDSQERTVLTRTLGEGTSPNHDTYYVYDHLGNLRCVLPPALSHQIASGAELPDTSAMMRQFAYVYRHDYRNRMIERRLPGKGPELMVYDLGDRAVMTQDSVMREDNRWLLVQYDALGRPLSQRMIVNTSSRETLQGMFNTRDTADLYASGIILEQTHYDDYDEVDPDLGFIAVEDVTDNTFDERTHSMMTYSRTAILEGHSLQNPAYVERAYYYDYKGRVIQTVELNHLGGISRTSVKYDFIGNILTQHESVQPSSNGPADLLVKTFTYDHRNRMLSETTTLNGAAPATMTYGYDELGKLVAKTYGEGDEAVTESLTYNIQGWLTEQSNPYFEARLKYYDPAKPGTAPSYTGNITEWDWQHKGPDIQTPEWNTYAFTYDKLSRLTDTRQYEGAATTPTDRFVERNLSYDKNGNFLTLQRYANGETLDNMVFSTYNGNQIETLTNNDIDYSYAYDPNGNMTTDGVSALKLEYNFLNLVSEAKDLSNNPKATYTWQAGEVKTGVKDAAGTSGFEYLGSLVYKRTGTSTIELESAAFGGGRFIKSSGTVTPNYFLTDHLGSTRAVVTINNASRTLVEQSDYYPYGMRHENTDLAISDNRFRFSGKEDQTTGDIPMQDFGARFKGMTVPIWNRIDPLAEKYYSWSPYAYCVNNPVKNIDPDGKFPLLSNIVGGLVGAAVEYGSQVTANIIQKGFSTSAFTDNIDVADIAIAAGEGFLTSGASVVKSVAVKTTVVVASEVVRNTVDVKTQEGGGVKTQVNDVSTAAKNTAIGLATSGVGAAAPKPKVNVVNAPTPKEAVKQARSAAPVNKQQRVEIQATAKQNQQVAKEINTTVSKTPAKTASDTASEIIKRETDNEP